MTPAGGSEGTALAEGVAAGDGSDCPGTALGCALADAFGDALGDGLAAVCATAGPATPRKITKSSAQENGTSERSGMTRALRAAGRRFVL
jgi:hypothetical protein